MAKKRIVKDYDALSEDILRQVKMAYPSGFVAGLISYTDAQGKKVSALPFETEDIYYLIRMTMSEAKQIVKDDEDYDDEGNLVKDNFPEVEVDEEFDGQGEDDDDASGGMDDEDDHIIVTRRRRGDDDDDDYADSGGGGGGSDDDY